MQITKSRCNAYLFRNSSFIYYFRRIIPLEIQPVLKRKEFKVSLGTRDRFKAILASAQLSHNIQQLFVSIKGGELSHHIDFKNILGLCVTGEATILPTGEIKFPPMKMDVNNIEKEKVLLEAYTAAVIQVQNSIMPPPAAAISPAAPEPVAQPATVPATSAAPQTLSTMIFSELVELFSAERVSNRKNIREDTRRSEAVLFKVFVDLIGDIPISQIDHMVVNDYKKKLMKLPAYAQQKWPGKNLLELTERNFKDSELLSNGSIDKHILCLGRLFKYAVRHGYMFADYTDGKTLGDSRDLKSIRDVFKPDEITTIITKAKNAYDKNSTGNSREMYWINLIAMYTGMRLDEICSLKSQDVYEYQETDNPLIESSPKVWVFDVKESADRLIKTGNSIRVIPLHSELMRRGLLQYLKLRKDGGYEYLWNLKSEAKVKKTCGYIMSKRIGTFFKKINIKKGLVFHCWRHTVTDILMKSGVEEKYQNAVLGHAQTGEGYKRYGKGFSLGVIIETIETIRYPKVKI